MLNFSGRGTVTFHAPLQLRERACAEKGPCLGRSLGQTLDVRMTLHHECPTFSANLQGPGLHDGGVDPEVPGPLDGFNWDVVAANGFDDRVANLVRAGQDNLLI